MEFGMYGSVRIVLDGINHCDSVCGVLLYRPPHNVSGRVIFRIRFRVGLIIVFDQMILPQFVRSDIGAPLMRFPVFIKILKTSVSSRRSFE